MRFGVIVFPGSNGDHDALHAIGEVLGQPVRAIWHRETSLDDIEYPDVGCLIPALAAL